MDSPYLLAALRYIRLGWPVFPLAPRSKEPLISKGAGGNGFKDATLNETVARAWWEARPDANVALTTGHRFFVVDIDAGKGGDETWDMLRQQHGAMPDTVEAETGGGGRHILYAMPDFPVRNSQSKIGPGIDVRGQGGYIVAAPSLHPETGRAYQWDGLREIEETPIAQAPDWLIGLVRKEAEGGRGKPGLPEKIKEGGRNDTLFRAACRLRRSGWSVEEITAALRVTNQTRCDPPLGEAEIKQIAESSGKYAPHAGADLFGGTGRRPPARPGSELPLTMSDVEIAADQAIAANDLFGAMKLAENVAKLRPADQVLIKTKFKLHFKKEFRSADFDRILRDHAPRWARFSPATAGGGDGSGDDGDNVTSQDSPGGPDLLGFPLTDSGNGERMALLYGDELRWCVEMQKWLVWDGVRWKLDDYQVATQKAKLMARLLYAQAIGRSPVEKHARASESANGIAAALRRAATEQGIAIMASELDQQPYLLNCLNGVVDLRDGKLLPHDRGYLITKMCHLAYDPAATCPRFLAFLHWAMKDNPDNEMTQHTVRLISFLQRAFGYALTADVSEKCVFVFWGARGNNGKTTLLMTFRHLLNEYSAQIGIDTLMTIKTQDAALRADLADLRGARFVTTSEVEREHKLSEGKLKYITAGSSATIKSCRKYENPIEFQPTHKLFMDCNHRPTVRGSDDAIWRRLRPIPFDVSIEETDDAFDKKLGEKLLAEATGILAWAVRGAIAWAKEGLGDAPEISEANTAWREHDDPLKEFLDDCCKVGDEAYWVRQSELTAAYEWWCRKNRERFPLGREHLGDRLRARGFKQSRSRRDGTGRQMRTWEGVMVSDETAKEMRNDGGVNRGLTTED